MRFLPSALLGLLACVGAWGAPARDMPLRQIATVLPLGHAPAVPAAPGARAVAPIPSWKYSVTASSDLGGGTYAGTVLGTDPHATAKSSTSIKVLVVPLIVTINDGSTTQIYDPTVADPCNGNKKAVSLITQSPIFTKTTAWTMNGVSVGTTQYVDAFQRAEFWSLVHGSNYHVTFAPKVLAKQAQSFTGSANGLNYNAAKSGGCGYIGVVNITDLDTRIMALINGPLKSTVNAGNFPIFITKDVVESESGVSLKSCCVLGYHGAFSSGGNLQIYSPFAFDTSGLFGGDVHTLSHEMAEAVNDPSGTNPTPTWGNIGQTVGLCQSNFEVGDPLSEGFGTVTNPFTVAGSNGFTYHMQELAFFSWFYGAPSLGAGGKYSDNGSFGGDAILCADGGGTH